MSIRVCSVLSGMFAVCSQAAAATPGVPDWVRPGPLPTVTFLWLNDAFGGEIGSNTDDFRSNAIALQIRHRRWLFLADHAVLTAKDDLAKDQGSRLDEVSFAAGYVVLDQQQHVWDRYHGAVGLGARYSGSEAGGEDIQNGWHEVIAKEKLRLDYEDTEEWDAYAWWQLNGLLSSRALFDVPGIDFVGAGRWGVSAETTGRALSNNEIQGEIGSRFLLLGREGILWLGSSYAWRAGEPHNHTAEEVAAREEGPYLNYGIQAGIWFVEGGWNWDTDASIGRVGLSWGRHEDDALPGDETVIGEFGQTFGSEGLGAQLRWQPEDFTNRAILADSRLFIDLRFGSVATLEIEGNDSISQQVLLGFDWTPFAWEAQWLRCEGMVQAGGGVRIESLEADGPDPTFADQRAVAPVVQGAVGIRLWTEICDHRVGLSGSYDAWLPIWDEPITGAGGSRAALNQPDQGISVRLMTSVQW